MALRQPFRDGNKRVAFVTAATFLGLNGLDFITTEEDVIDVMLALAAGDLEVEQVADWIRSRVGPTR